MAEKYLVSNGSAEFTLEIERDGDRILMRREGADQWHRVRLDTIGNSGLYLLMVDSHPTELYLERRRGGAMVTLGRHVIEYDVERWRPSLASRDRRKSAAEGIHEVKAPMTGSIVEVMRQVGDRVEAGDVVLVIESMKMNNELRSPAAGVIEEVRVKAGQRVDGGAVLAIIKA